MFYTKYLMKMYLQLYATKIVKYLLLYYINPDYPVFEIIFFKA